MTVVEWDKSGDRIYQTGVDHGVLYLKDGRVVPWNGLTSVDDGSNADLKSYYLDGIKILDHVTPGDFVGKISAFTYPDEFEEVIGAPDLAPGLTFYEQRSKSFNLSWRTRIGNDLDENYGYKIHLLYNVLAIPDSHSFESIQERINAPEFSWALSGTPPIGTIDGIRPTAHVSIDSTKIQVDILEYIEDVLYGTVTTDPRFPSIGEIKSLIDHFEDLDIIDNGDGTWQAVDWNNDYITMIDATTFQIDGADAIYPEMDTYRIEDTNFPIDEKIWLSSPNNDKWVVVATDDGTLEVLPDASNNVNVFLDKIKMKSPDEGLWEITVTNDGYIDIAPSVAGGDIVAFVGLKSSDNDRWILTVTDDGTLDISPA